jgi:prepilin peptidase CpaA
MLALAMLPALLLAALSDVALRIVPNRLPAVVACTGLAARAMSGDLRASAMLTAIVFGLLFACWRRGWMGGGDVKLLTACTLLVPAIAVGGLLLSVTLAGGVLSIFYLLGRLVSRRTAHPSGRSASMLRRVLRVEAWRIRRHAPVPYACAIGAGCAFTLFAG